MSRPTIRNSALSPECRRTVFQSFLLIFLAGLFSTAAHAQWAPLNPVASVQQQDDGVLFTMKAGALKLQVCTDSIIRARHSGPSTFSSLPDPVVTKREWPKTKWTMQSTPDDVTLTTSRLAVTVTRKDGAITYRDLSGAQLVQEGSRKLTPVKVNGEDTFRAESFINIYGSREGLYGLGQHQAGVWNYRGESCGAMAGNAKFVVPDKIYKSTTKNCAASRARMTSGT